VWTVTDEVRRAYAVLGLPSRATPEQIKRRYRILVKMWHPDRFASDPAAQAEASDRLTHINRAYRMLSGRNAFIPDHSAPSDEAPGASSPHRLTREEIDGIVRAIGNVSALDSALGWVEWGLWGPITSLDLMADGPRSVVIGVVLALVLIAIELWLGWGVAFLIAISLAIVPRVLSSLQRSRTL
jgi:hypothetical protein